MDHENRRVRDRTDGIIDRPAIDVARTARKVVAFVNHMGLQSKSEVLGMKVLIARCPRRFGRRPSHAGVVRISLVQRPRIVGENHIGLQPGERDHFPGEVRLEFKDAQSAGQMRPEDGNEDVRYRYILMPMRI